LVILAIEHLQHANPPFVKNIDSAIQVFRSEILARCMEMMAAEKREK
jgi:hypothetical protein